MLPERASEALSREICSGKEAYQVIYLYSKPKACGLKHPVLLFKLLSIFYIVKHSNVDNCLYIISLFFLYRGKQRRNPSSKGLSYSDSDREKWKKVLVTQLMSSDESDNEENQAVFVKQLPQRSDKVTAFFESYMKYVGRACQLSNQKGANRCDDK